MTPPTETREQMVLGPFAGAVMGGAAALCTSTLFSATTAIWIGVLVGGVMCGGLCFTVFRSTHGSLQGYVSTLVMLTMLVVVVAGAAGAVSALFVSRSMGLAVLAFLSVGMVAVQAGVSYQTHRVLRREGSSNEWLKTHVDFVRGRIVSTQSPWPPVSGWLRSPWLIGALAANVPLIWRLWGGTDAQIVLLLLPVMTTCAVMIIVQLTGPTLGRAVYLTQIEKQMGLRLMHHDLAQLQALRRSWWLSRWLMPRVPSLEAQVPPYEPQQNGRQRLKRKRRSG
jgi:hypothetical protein